MKREDKEERLQGLIASYLEQLGQAELASPAERTLRVIARSPESPIARAARRHFAALIDAGVSISAIFAVPEPDKEAQPWLETADMVRWAKDIRLIEAHEQLVLGESLCWTGDAMRREPTKIDTFEATSRNCALTALFGRRAFEKLSRACVAVPLRHVTGSLRGVPKGLPPTVQPSGPEADASQQADTTRH